MNGMRKKTVIRVIAFTWSPDQKEYSYFKNPRKQLVEQAKVIRVLGLCSYYKIYPEFHVNGNLHYHGVIEIFDNVKWYKKVLPTFKYHGFVCVKESPNEKWDDYCLKNIVDTQKVLKAHFPLTDSHDIRDAYIDYCNAGLESLLEVADSIHESPEE